MKKLILGSLALMLTLGLSGCGDSKDSDTKNSEYKAKTTVNSKLSCTSIESSIRMACPSNINEKKNAVTVIIGDLENMQYKCRQSNCSNAQDINQGLFLLKETYAKYDKADSIDFSMDRCLVKDESYILQMEQKIKACKVAEQNIETFQTMFH